jgi:hypothetical protein
MHSFNCASASAPRYTVSATQSNVAWHLQNIIFILPDERTVVRKICPTDIIYTTAQAWHTSLSKIPDLLEVSEKCVLGGVQHKIVVRGIQYHTWFRSYLRTLH